MSGEVDAFTYAAAAMSQEQMQEQQARRIAAMSQQQVNGGLMQSGNAIWSSPQVTKTNVMMDKVRSRVSVNLSILQADNGFVVNIQEQPYTDPTPHVALTIEDVCTIITSQLASRMLDKAE